MAITTMVPINLGNAGGLPQTFTGKGQSGDAPDRAKLHNEPRVPALVAWLISGNPLIHKEFLQKLQTFSWHPGDQKINQTTILCLQNGLAGVHRGIRIPLMNL